MKSNRFCMFLATTMLGISLLAGGCSKGGGGMADDDEEPDMEYPDQVPGTIPGFGEADGEPEGTAFVLPEGVELVEAIRGNENGPEDECLFDGPGYNVVVKIKLRRTIPGGSPLRVEFPAGLVIVTTTEGRNQNGLLVEKTIVELPPLVQGGGGSRCDITLLLLCTNQKRDPSSSYHTYKFGPVTNAPLIRDFVKRLQGKKINFSDYTPEQEEEMLEIQQIVQEALYALTDGHGYNPYLLAQLAGLPNR